MPFAHLAAVLEEAAPIGERFVAAGHRAYLVGGIVRDLWLDRTLAPESDLDLTTDALPDETKAVMGPVSDALWLQGERFGTIGAKIGDREFEITTHRSESYASHSRKPEVAFASALDEDLARRDFTVNAMAVELPGGELIDPFGGAHDLTARVLRTPLDPETSFTDDPLRMLRAARFTAGYSLAPAPELAAAIEILHERMDIVSAERVRDELDKLLVVDQPSAGLELLAETGILERVLPEAMTPTFRSRRLDVNRLPRRAALRLAALLVDVPVDVALGRLRELKYPNERLRHTRRMLEAARAIDDRPVDAESYRRWFDAVGDDRDDAQALAMLRDPRHASTIGEMEVRRLQLGDELHDFSLPIGGAEVMDLLGASEGPVVGEALEYLRGVRYAHGPLDADEACRLLIDWAADRGSVVADE